MSPLYKYLFLFIIFFVGCIGQTQPNSQDSSDSLKASNDNPVDTLYHPYDWTPEEFRNLHPDEWYVVMNSIDIQQREEDIDYVQIDSLVRGYIVKKDIVLPKDVYQQIIRIEEICKSEFDISGYDESNMGTNIADGTARLFEGYVVWLLEDEAKKVKNTGIIISEEVDKLRTLMHSFYNCCDSIGYAFDGSGGWHGWGFVHRMELDFKKDLFSNILCPIYIKDQPILLSPQQFEDECNARYVNYKRNWEYATTYETYKAYLDDYSDAMRQWLDFRSRVESNIKNPKLKSSYSFNTRSFARKHFIHLKNQFEDIGMVSWSMYESYLKQDCSDEEMLNYSYEDSLE